MVLSDRPLSDGIWWLIVGPPLPVFVALAIVAAWNLVARCKACGRLMPPETETCPRCGAKSNSD